MFIKTIYSNDLKNGFKEYFSLLKNNEVLQIIHRGNGIKVALSQDYFFKIFEKARAYDELKNK